MVDQLALFSPDSSTGNVLYVGNITIAYESVREGLLKYLSLMGIFSLLPPNVSSVNIISSGQDPWIIPTPDQIDTFGKVMMLSPIEHMY